MLDHHAVNTQPRTITAKHRTITYLPPAQLHTTSPISNLLQHSSSPALQLTPYLHSLFEISRPDSLLSRLFLAHRFQDAPPSPLIPCHRIITRYYYYLLSTITIDLPSPCLLLSSPSSLSSLIHKIRVVMFPDPIRDSLINFFNIASLYLK